MKKKIVALFFTAFIFFMAVGCSSENKNIEINKLNKKISELNEQISELNAKINETSEVIDDIFTGVSGETEENIVITEVDNNISEINNHVDDKTEEPTVDPYAELDNFEVSSEYITIQGQQFSTELRQLSLDGIKMTNTDIEQLRYMVNLEHLNIPLFDTDILFSTNTRSDISALSELANLTSLHLGFTIMNDISPLAGLTNLTELSIASWFISDISPLAELTKLAELNITNSRVRNLSVLAELENLTSLALGSEFIIRDFSPLTELPYLTNLYLKLNHQPRDISVFKELTNLKSLHLSMWGDVGGADLPLLNTAQVIELIEALPNTEIK